MADWTLVPCLVSLRAEFNALAPGRDKASDGSIGDTSHASSSSDHNPDDTPGTRTPSTDADSDPEVHAIDVDADLRKAGWTMNRALAIIIGRHRDGHDDRLQNVIYNRRIWSRSWGWTARTYTGSNAHTQHAHFSARYTTAQEADTRPWGLIEEDSMTPDELLAADLIPNDINPGVKGQAGYNENMTVLWALRYASRAQLAYAEASAARKDIAALAAQVKALAERGPAMVSAERVVELIAERLNNPPAQGK